MEYQEGETLDEVVQRRGKMLPGEAVRLTYQALQGLQHIHLQQLVHRDLKPSNLMLVNPAGALPDNTLRATVKILDIGLGRALFEDTGREQALDAGLTGEGMVLGTPDYMAPEQARDPRSTDIRADIYSLGCVLYHLLAGHPPFPDTNFINQMIRHATEQPRPLKEINPAVPDGLQQILNWMMAKDPNGRYPTPERAAQALQVFLAAGSDPAIDPTADPKMKTFLSYLKDNKRDQPPEKRSRRDRGERGRSGSAPGPTAPVGNVPPGSGKPNSGAGIPAVPGKPETRKVKTLKAARLGRDQGGGTSSREERLHKKRKKKRHLPPPIPGAPAAAVAAPVAAPAMIDVELVPVTGSAADPPPAAGGGMRLSRRDLFLLGAGAAAGALASFVGCLFALRGK
jgi:serine/threonine protein kinase